MDINWTELLDEVQDLRAALEAWGITYEILIALGVSALALFLVSLREIVVWYLRISQLQAQMLHMSKQLSQIQTSVDQVQVKQDTQIEAAQQAAAGPAKVPVFQDSPAEEAKDEEDAKKAVLKKFNLDH